MPIYPHREHKIENGIELMPLCADYCMLLLFHPILTGLDVGFQNVLQELESKRPQILEIQKQADRIKRNSNTDQDRQRIQTQGKTSCFYIFLIFL